MALLVLQYSLFFVTKLLFSCVYSFNFNVWEYFSIELHVCSCEASWAVYMLSLE